MKTAKPAYFKFAFLSSSSGKFGGALYVSINTLLVALGASAFQVGLVNLLQTIGETFSQFVGLWYINLFSSRRKSEILSMIIIGLPVLLLAIVAFIQMKYWFVVISGIAFFSGLSGKASYLCWYSWMGSIVPQKLRNYFFGTRSFFGQIGQVTGFIIAFFVLKLNFPILILLGFLYFFSYVFNMIETGTYFLHPDSGRQIIVKNHIIHRMSKVLKDRDFLNFLCWFTLLSGALIANILYLEFFMINVLKLAYSWIPISFVLLALSSAASFYSLRNYFSIISYSKKRLIISILVLLSCIFWLFANSVLFFALSLFLAGFSSGALTLSEKVDLINHSTINDKEANYAVFNFAYPLFSSVLILFLSMFQIFKFNFHITFYITIALTFFSLVFIKKFPRATLSQPKPSIFS